MWSYQTPRTRSFCGFLGVSRNIEATDGGEGTEGEAVLRSRWISQQRSRERAGWKRSVFSGLPRPYGSDSVTGGRRLAQVGRNSLLVASFPLPLQVSEGSVHPATFLGRPLPIGDRGWLDVAPAVTPGAIRELVTVPGLSVPADDLHRNLMERTDEWFFFFFLSSFFFFFLFCLSLFSFSSIFL
jgi:hypothetical protein